MPHARRRRLHVTLQSRGSNKRKRRQPLRSSKVSIPLLSLLTYVDHVEQIRTGFIEVAIPDSTKIRDWDVLDWRFRKKQKADRCVRGSGKVFELVERWLYGPLFPRNKLRKALHQRLLVIFRSLASPG